MKSEKRKALAGKISKIQEPKPAIGPFSEWIVENRFDCVEVQHIINGPKGDRIVLQSPIKEKVKKPTKQLVGSKVNSNHLRKEYTNFGQRDQSTDGDKKPKAKAVRVLDGEEAAVNKRDARTTRTRDKQQQVVYANVAGHRLEFSSEKKRERVEAENSKENQRSNGAGRVQEAPDEDWKRDMQALKRRREEEQSEPLDSEEIDFDDELLLNEIGKNGRAPLTQDRINYLEEFLASKAKKLGFYATSQAVQQSAILSRVISDQASQKIFQLIENIKKAALLEQQAEENPLLQPAPKKKERIQTFGQPLSNFDRAGEWPSSNQPYISSLREEILAAKQRREEEREREKDFEEGQRRYFEAQEREEELRKQEAETQEREKREEEQRAKREKEERELEQKQRLEAAQHERDERDRKQMIERERQERERIKLVRDEMEVLEKEQERAEEERLERERAEKKKQGLGGRWDHRGGSDPANREDKKRLTNTDKLREMNERLRKKEIAEQNSQRVPEDPAKAPPGEPESRPAAEQRSEPEPQTPGSASGPAEKQAEPSPPPQDPDQEVELEMHPEPIVPQQDVFEIDDEELVDLKKDSHHLQSTSIEKKEQPAPREPTIAAAGEVQGTQQIDRSDSMPPLSLSSMPPIEEGELLEDAEDQQAQIQLENLKPAENSKEEAVDGQKLDVPANSPQIRAPELQKREIETRPALPEAQADQQHEQTKLNRTEPEGDMPTPHPKGPEDPIVQQPEGQRKEAAEDLKKEFQEPSKTTLIEGQAAPQAASQQDGQLLSN